MKAKQSEPNTPKLPEDVENRVRELYLKDYVADETESREMILIGMKDPWYEWWINIIAQELSTLKAQVRREIEELRHASIKSDTSFHDFCYSEALTDCLSIPSLKGKQQ